MSEKSSKGMKIIRIAWVVQVGLIFFMCMISLYFFPKTVEPLIKLLPFLAGLTVVEGGAAWSGSNVKRLTESKPGKKK